MSDDIERVETTTVGELAHGVRSFLEVPVEEHIITSQGAQDLRDGAALRRLRDLAPVTAGIVIGWTHGRVHIRVTSFDVTTLGDGIAATIAEAADKCREAIRARRTAQDER